MKNVIVLILLLCGFVIQAMACEITLEMDGAAKKEVYNVGDEIVVHVHVKNVHRICKLDIEETTYEPVGLKILAATDWKEISKGVFERKMKMKVIGSLKGDISLLVRRKCIKENNFGILTLKSFPPKRLQK
jgi:hypothetical protein